MRKKQKYITTGAKLGFGIGAIVDVLMQWSEHVDKGEKFTWDSFDGTRTLTTGLQTGMIGAASGYLYYEIEGIQERNTPFSADLYLKQNIRNQDLKENPELLNFTRFFRDKLKKKFASELRGKLAGAPKVTGSFAKKTAISSDYDVDILIPFKKNSYSSLEEMYDSTYELLNDWFGHDADVIKRTSAIGLRFEREGNEIHFDIIPGREMGNYVIDNRLNLYARPSSIWRRGTSKKINSYSQGNLEINHPSVRRVNRLIKLYALNNSLSVPSVILEQSVIEAMSETRYGIFKSDTENLLNAMSFLAEKLDQDVYLDHDNSNNNLNSKMSSWQRQQTSELLRSDILKIEDSPHYIQEVFEVN
jgi:predicted nucleotidyltransferase